MDAHRDLIPISLVAHHVFCPRRAWLESVGETTDTHQVQAGTQSHGASDDVSASRPTRLRSVDVESVDFGVVGRCDSVELDSTGRATVVEFKATPVRRRPEVTKPMVVQLTLQAAALAEQGREVVGAAVWFTSHQVRVPVAIGPEEVELARDHVTLTADLLASGTAPPPLEDDPRCLRCSHAGVCLPDERLLRPVTRRVLVADPDTQVLHVTSPGARASIRAGRVRVTKGDEEIGSVPVERVLALVVHGNVDVSSGLLRELLWRSLPIVWCSSAGKVIGWASPADSPNGGPRARQGAASAIGNLDLARQFVVAKIANQATLLRRHGHAAPAVLRLRRLQREAAVATSVVELFGAEGEAASLYFGAFDTMLTPRVRAGQGLHLEVRTRRPARDPLNAALNFCYGLLVADVIRALVACGLDPHAGFLHSSERNKPALALDVCEEFRAPVADSTVIGAFNNGELSASDFFEASGSTRLRPGGRKALVAAYERRVLTEFTHPLFRYKVTWRRAMEIQSRLVLGVIDGTQARYRGITTR